MKIEAASKETVNRLFRPGRVQAIVDEFQRSEQTAVHVILSHGEYSSIGSAQSSFTATIRRLGYSIIARTFKGELYLLKV